MRNRRLKLALAATLWFALIGVVAAQVGPAVDYVKFPSRSGAPSQCTGAMCTYNNGGAFTVHKADNSTYVPGAGTVTSVACGNGTITGSGTCAPSFTQVNALLATANAPVTIGSSSFTANSLNGSLFGSVFATYVESTVTDLRTADGATLWLYSYTPASLSHTIQNGPSVAWVGSVWNAGASHTVDMWAALHPVVSGSPTGKLQFMSQIDSGDLVDVAAIETDGRISNVTDPSGAQDVATKNYSDAHYLGISATATATNALKSASTTVNVSSATAPTSGQVLTATSGTAATWQTPSAGSANTGGWSVPLLCKSGAISCPTLGGDYTTGITFQFLQTGTVSTARIYWPGGLGATSVKVSLWDSAATLRGSGTVAVNAAGLYTVTMGSPISVGVSDVGFLWTIGMYETGTGSETRSPDADVPYAFGIKFIWAPYLMMVTTFLYDAGDTRPTIIVGAGTGVPVEPIFTP
jgi:hypothetical protein